MKGLFLSALGEGAGFALCTVNTCAHSLTTWLDVYLKSTHENKHMLVYSEADEKPRGLMMDGLRKEQMSDR